MKLTIEMNNEEMLKVLDTGSLKALGEDLREEGGSARRIAPNDEEKASNGGRVEFSPEPKPTPTNPTPTSQKPQEEVKAVKKPEHTFEEIQKVAGDLARGGKREELKKLLDTFELRSLTELKEDAFDAFTVGLIKIGGSFDA